MIDILQYTAQFCFWLFLALVLVSLCAIGIWTLISVVRSMRRRK